MKHMIIALALLVASASAFAGKQDKVDICHFDADAGMWELINVNGNALEAHFGNHDDGYPADATTQSEIELDENCEQVVCPCWADASALTSAKAASYAGLTPPSSCDDASDVSDPDDYWTRYRFIGATDTNGQPCTFNTCSPMSFGVGYQGVVPQPPGDPDPTEPVGYFCGQHDGYDGPPPPSISFEGISEQEFHACEAILEEFAASEYCP